MAALRPLPATSPMTTRRPSTPTVCTWKKSPPTSLAGTVDGVDLEARRGQLFLGNEQLLHAARGGQLVGGAFLIALDAEEAEEDDEHDDENAGVVAEVGEVDGNGAGLEGERRSTGGAAFAAHGGDQGDIDDAPIRLIPSGTRKQTRLKVAVHRGGDEGAEDEDRTIRSSTGG